MNRKQRRAAAKQGGAGARGPDAANVGPALLAEAARQHEAGRLAEAERLYRRLLADDPNRPDCLHLLGLVAHQTGRSEAALEADENCRMFTSLQVLRSSPVGLMFCMASTQRKEVIRCLMVQQRGRFSSFGGRGPKNPPRFPGLELPAADHVEGSPGRKSRRSFFIFDILYRRSSD